MLVRKEYELGSHKDFRVRRSNVLHAFQWLKANKYYRSISINDQAPQQLPQDGDLAHCIATITDDEQVVRSNNLASVMNLLIPMNHSFQEHLFYQILQSLPIKKWLGKV